MLMHEIQVPLVYIVSLLTDKIATTSEVPLGVFVPLFIGATQFLYLGPVIYLKLRQQEYEFVKGVWICAGVTALLNSICWVIFVLKRARPSFSIVYLCVLCGKSSPYGFADL